MNGFAHRSVARLGALVAAAALCGAPRPAAADWPVFGQSLCGAPEPQFSPAITGDGAGGAIVAWIDERDTLVNVYAEHVLANGAVDPAWPANGRLLRTDRAAVASEPEDPAFPAIVKDGAGGAIVAWQDGRNAATVEDIYAQHVLAGGAVDPAWPANGVALCVMPGSQDIPTMVADGAGGAVVTWMDGRNGTGAVDVYAQHVLARGTVDPAWPVNGLAVCTAAGAQAFPEIASDGAGGALVTWYDSRSGVSGLDIYAQHVLGTGATDPAWPADGRALCTATGNQSSPKLVPDGLHGAIVTWEDTRGGANHVFAQHVRGDGTVDPAWPADGRAVSVSGIEEIEPHLASDLAHGAVIVFEDARSLHHNTYAQHVLASGALDPAWPAGGAALSVTATEQSNPRLVSDGAGGALVTWQDRLDVIAQHVLPNGALDPAYPAAGRPLADLPSAELEPAITGTDGGGAIVAWTDFRGAGDGDIFALQVQAAGVAAAPPGPAPAAISFAPPAPNPAPGGAVALRFALPFDAHVTLAVYDSAGRRVRTLVTGGVMPAGEHALAWDGRDATGHPVRAGLYFARLTADGDALTRKVVTL